MKRIDIQNKVLLKIKPSPYIQVKEKYISRINIPLKLIIIKKIKILFLLWFSKIII